MLLEPAKLPLDGSKISQSPHVWFDGLCWHLFSAWMTSKVTWWFAWSHTLVSYFLKQSCVGFSMQPRCVRLGVGGSVLLPGPFVSLCLPLFSKCGSMGERKSGSMGPRGPAMWQAAPKVKMPLPAVLSGPVRNHGEVPAIWPFWHASSQSFGAPWVKETCFWTSTVLSLFLDLMATTSPFCINSMTDNSGTIHTGIFFHYIVQDQTGHI